MTLLSQITTLLQGNNNPRMEGKKKPIPVPVEKALKSFNSFLSVVKEDLVCGVGSIPIREKRTKLLEQLQAIQDVLPKHMTLDLPANAREAELVELAKSAQEDIHKNFAAAQTRWVDFLLDKVSIILDSTQHVNLEKLTNLMEKNDTAGDCMEGKDVILLLGSPGSGKPEQVGSLLSMSK